MDTTFQDHYSVLGVPVDADQAAIRRAFRLKVRELHPDVAADKVAATEAFLKVKDAYAVLSDPQTRTTYDLQRANRRAREREQSQAHARRATRPTPPPGGDTWDRHQRSLSIPELLARAMQEIRDGRYGHARGDLGQILAREPLNPDALVLMGRLYQAEGRIQEWIRTLEQGIRANPGHVALRLALNEARRASTEQPRVSLVTAEDIESRKRAYAAFGIAMAAGAFLWGMLKPGPPVSILEWATQAPSPLLVGGAICALFSGWTMAATGFISAVDDELFYPDTHGHSLYRKHATKDPSLGLAVPPMALIHYSMAVFVMVGLMVSRGVFSRSLTLVTALAFGLALAMSGVSQAHAPQILFWCPGWLLFAEFVGWFVGDLFRS